MVLWRRLGSGVVVTLGLWGVAGCSDNSCVPPTPRSRVEQPGLPFTVSFQVLSGPCPEVSGGPGKDCGNAQLLTPGSPELDIGGAYWQADDPSRAVVDLNAEAVGSYSFDGTATITDHDHAVLRVASANVALTRRTHFGCA